MFNLQLAKKVKLPYANVKGRVLSLSLSRRRCGLGVTFSPREPSFLDSNPAKLDRVFQDVNVLSASPLGPEDISGTLKKTAGLRLEA